MKESRSAYLQYLLDISREIIHFEKGVQKFEKPLLDSRGVASKSSLASYWTTPGPNVKAQITVERTLSRQSQSNANPVKRLRVPTLDESVGAIGAPLKMLMMERFS
jgi:hypothetical protein